MFGCYTCFVTTNVCMLRMFCYNKCLGITHVLLQQMFACYACFVTTNVWVLHMFCYNKCLHVTHVLLQQMFGYYTCFVTTNVWVICKTISVSLHLTNVNMEIN